jgi:hypothetical protein
MNEPASQLRDEIPTPTGLRLRVTELARDRARHQEELATTEQKLQATANYLTMAPKVEAALQSLSDKLFDETLRVLEDKLSIALQEVLDQPIRLKADPSFRRGSVSVDFYIERAGQHEDIMRGQGGSVANVLSVGLRLFALAGLDRKKHRRFLVLDEQDCWLRPELVPRLVKIIKDAATALGFQVLLISHFDVSAFETYADRIYNLVPQADGSVVAEMETGNPNDEIRMTNQIRTTKLE